MVILSLYVGNFTFVVVVGDLQFSLRGFSSQSSS